MADAAPAVNCGDRRKYQSGCHCTSCTAANTAYHLAYRAAVRAQHPPLGARVPAAPALAVVADLLDDGFSRVTIARALGQQKLKLYPSRAAVTLRTLCRLRWVQRWLTS